MAVILSIGTYLATVLMSAAHDLNYIHLQKRRQVHLSFAKLDPAEKYEIRTYIGVPTTEDSEDSADIHWIGSPPPPGLLPCPLPEAILTEGIRRNWRTGRELMDKGLEVKSQFGGNTLWVCYHKTEPGFARSDNATMSLEGEWRIVRDPGDRGKILHWDQPSQYPVADSEAIQVPGTVNEVYPGYNGIVWYSKAFATHWPEPSDLQPILRFKACSYRCEAWLNGHFIGSHEGGESPFQFTVSQRLQPERNNLIIRVFFPMSSFMHIPWWGGVDSDVSVDRFAYPVFWGMGGLIQGVDLVLKPRVRIGDVFVRTDWKTGAVKLQMTLVNETNAPARLKLSADYGEFKSVAALGRLEGEFTAPQGESSYVMETTIKPFHLWSLDAPFLYHAIVSSRWGDAIDTYEVRHFGFRDFRINPHGYFELNGKRLFLKCSHGINLDPLTLEGTPRDMTWLGVDFEMLKAAGFNTYRSAEYATLPEQLDLADELGFLIYSEHQAAGFMKDPAKFSLDLPGLLRRDRNHPSLVMWGLLNEVGAAWAQKDTDTIYRTARDFLPQLRAIDDSRLILLSSGRFDKDLKTGSASNPESTEWNVFLGGENADKPIAKNKLFDGGPYQAGAGDVHIYESNPISWEFIESMGRIAEGVRPIFVSEAGQGSAIDPFGFRRSRVELGVASRIEDTIEPRGKDLEAIWSKYHLFKVYAHPEDVVAASQEASAAERALFLNVIRSNPGINGYSMTDLTDTPDGEGIMDEFRHFKAGHLSMLKEGWAKLRWCLLVNPTNAYVGQSFRIRVSLANEDVLPAGRYPVQIFISGPSGPVWSKDISLQVQSTDNAPLAYRIFDEDLKIDGLGEGDYTLAAKLSRGPEVQAGSTAFHLTSAGIQPDLRDVELVEIGINPSLRELLDRSGVVLRDFAMTARSAHEVILMGGQLKADDAVWQSLHERMAQGAFVIFLSREILSDKAGANQRVPVDQKGIQTGGAGEVNLWGSQIVALDHPVFAGLPHGLLTPQIYGTLLHSKARFSGMAVPDDVVAVWFNLNSSPGFHVTDKVADGVVIGTYRYRKGKFLVNSLDLIKNIGRPAADRLILNLVKYAHDQSSS